MHEIPLNSGFLAAKFIKLSERLDVHLMAWGKNVEVEKFIQQHHLNVRYKNRIHVANYKGLQLVKSLITVLFLLAVKTGVRNFLFNKRGTLSDKLKFLITYLPVIRHNWNVVHFEFGTLAIKATQLKDIIPGKLSVSFRGYDLNYVGLDNDKYYSEVWEKFDGFHFLSNDLKQRAIKRGYSGSKLEVLIPPAINTDIFKPNLFKKENEKLIIISVGRLVWKKGYEYAIRAAALLKQQGVQFEYRIIGSGDYEQALQYAISENGLNDKVKLLGTLSTTEIKNQLSEADVFVHPAISEGFSNAVIEAQAMGVPVICTDADGLPENIENSVTGFIVPRWSAEAIADKLQWCFNYKQNLQQMGLAGIERVQKHFTLEQQMEKFINYYQKLANG